MNNKLSKIIICTLIISMFFVFPLDNVSAEQEGNYIYFIKNGEAHITKYSGPGGVITIPSTLGGFPTVAIEVSAFKQRFNVTSVVIPDSIVAIGNYAFQQCHNLTSITIPNSVTTIGDFVFYDCWSLITVNIPNNVTAIGTGTFQNCYNLSSITISNDVTIIKEYAFDSCSSLSSITIPNNITTIGTGAFRYCSELSSVTIGRAVTRIEANAFLRCTSLTSITFLQLVVPGFIGENWIAFTPTEIRGHAYAASNFPISGADFHGLKMGTVIKVQNILPLAKFIWTPTNITVNQIATCDASTSSDPDGFLVLYEWDWNNDGKYDESSTFTTVIHSWTQSGDHPVTLRVTDNDNETNTKTIIIPVSSIKETNNKGTPGFEITLVLSAIIISFLMLKKIRNR